MCRRARAAFISLAFHTSPIQAIDSSASTADTVPMTFDDQLVAPLLLQYTAEHLRERGLRQVVQGDCFTLLDCYVDQALDTAAAPEYQLNDRFTYLDDMKRHGERLSLGAMIYVRKLALGKSDIAGPHNRARLRLRHFGYPSTFHLQLLATAAQEVAAELKVDVDAPLPTGKLIELAPLTPARVLIQATAAEIWESVSAVHRAELAARALCTDARANQINDGKEAAEKARAVARQKLREALATGGAVKLNTRHLSAVGNSQVAACLNAGLVIWGQEPALNLSQTEMIAALGKLAHDYAHGARREYVRLQRHQALVRTRLSPLAARLAA